jgi:hypothetical protein
MARILIVPMLVAAALMHGAYGADAPEVLRAQDIGEPARTSLDVFDWLVGQWQGTGLEGQIEEVWTGPVGNQMLGMFRLSVDDEVKIYELMTLVDEQGKVTLKVKHFGPDLTAWEDRGEYAQFELLRFSTELFQFDGLTLTHDGNQLVMHLRAANSSGAERIERIELERRSRLVVLTE